MVLAAACAAPSVLEMPLTEAVVEFVKAGPWRVIPPAVSDRAARESRHAPGHHDQAAELSTHMERGEAEAAAQIPYIREFIDLVASHPPATASPRGVAGSFDTGDRKQKLVMSLSSVFGRELITLTRSQRARPRRYLVDTTLPRRGTGPRRGSSR